MNYIVKVVSASGIRTWLGWHDDMPVLVMRPADARHTLTRDAAIRMASVHAARVRAMNEALGFEGTGMTYTVEEVVTDERNEPAWMTRKTRGV